MTTLTATEARKRFYKMLKAAASGNVFCIHHSRHGNAVMLSAKKYESMLRKVNCRLRQRKILELEGAVNWVGDLAEMRRGRRF